MSGKGKYSLSDIKLAAYNWKELPDMTPLERTLWEGIGYCYERYRAGDQKELCDELAQYYIGCYEEALKMLNGEERMSDSGLRRTDTV